MPEQTSTAGKPDDATNDMVAQVAARVIAAMREEATVPNGAAPASPTETPDPALPKVSGVVGAVQQQAVSRLDKQKEHAVEELASVAGTVRQMGDQLKQPEHGAVAQYAAQYGDMAADQLQHLSTYLRQHDVKQLVHEVEGFARREPLLFSGGAFVLGLIGARFLKSKPVAETSLAETNPMASPITISPVPPIVAEDELSSSTPVTDAANTSDVVDLDGEGSDEYSSVTIAADNRG